MPTKLHIALLHRCNACFILRLKAHILIIERSRKLSLLRKLQCSFFFDRAELHDKFLTHFSHLEEVIEQLVGLAGSV
ncbi:hypothetical protein RHSIM_Rhsim09G0049100 [Rhododendron simsii]|uniref:Uncharacterized protein n=1 Tax=Rhododendron simsii TaxID=118357 RepID=A0A834LFJ9_RHOSS|nr:hypothetical protein RHSIM_Rhsim09G0049100 [Rhododendron simsii]